MAVINRTLGARIVATIGRRGEAPNLYPGVITGPAHVVQRDNGRMVEVAQVVLVQENLQGQKYLSTKLHDLAFAFDRTDLIELLDGTEDEPKQWQDLVREQNAAALAFTMGRPAPSSKRPSSVAVAEVEDAPAPAATAAKGKGRKAAAQPA